MATIKRTGGADFPNKLKALVSGPPKSGKTTLLGTIPNIIIADTEPRANNLASLAHLDVPYVTINRAADLRELQMVLSNDSMREEAAKAAGMERIDAVAIDTMDTLQKILKRERLEEQRTTKFLRDDWAWMKDEMIKIVEGFTSLPLHVVFTVHLKTKEVGTEDHPQTKILPGLEGAFADEIAGMVGYSFLSFRKEEIGPNGPYTKYWLRAEGDETYDFVGNRAAGRLPDVIEPDFGKVYSAAMAGRPQPTQQQPTQMPQISSSSSASSPADQAPPATPQAPQAQPSGSGQASGSTEAPQQAQQQAPEQSTTPSTPSEQSTTPATPAPAAPAQQEAQQPPAQGQGPARAPDGDPMSEAALQHVGHVYKALQLPLPEAKLRAATLGDARGIVKMWQAIQADHHQGKAEAGTTAEADMREYLEALDLLPDQDQPQPQPQQGGQAEAKLDGTVAEVKAWVGDGSDLARVNEAYQHEQANKKRTSLLEWLQSKGASDPAPATQTDVQSQSAPGDQPVAEPAAAPETPAAEPVAEVTPEPSTADDTPTEGEAVQAVEEELGGTVIDQTVNADAKCDDCENQVDDPDIAKLAKTRFGRVLCVNDYIAASKAS